KGPKSAYGTFILFAIAFYWFTWRWKRPDVRFCSLYVVLSTLPTVFLERGGGPSMYIPVVGWIILGAILLIEVSKRLPAPERIALPGFALFFVAYLAGESKSTSRDAIYNGQQKTWNYIQETKRLELHVPSDGSILFLDD